MEFRKKVEEEYNKNIFKNVEWENDLDRRFEKYKGKDLDLSIDKIIKKPKKYEILEAMEREELEKKK